MVDKPYYSFLFYNLSLKEFNELKKYEKSFNEMLVETKEAIQVSLKYNMQRECVGIFVKKNGKEKLILYELELNEFDNSEEGLVKRLHIDLFFKIDEIKIKKEDWIDKG